MFRFILILLFVIIPTIEITIMIFTGKVIGILPTLLLILLTGVLGVAFAKREGLQTLRLAQLQLQQGQIPSEAIVDGFCILIGAILLIAPGFVTDFIGLFLLIPITRTFGKALLKNIFSRMIKNGQFIIISRK